MGCNFYYKNGKDLIHIGKRSAAGLYCWDCNLTLCKGGNEGVHDASSVWSDHCIICGKYPNKEDLTNNSAGRELGFNVGPYKRRKGVASCSSFSWAINPEKLKRVKKKIVDEYGENYSKKEFSSVLEECPIQYFRNIGKVFC